MMKIIIMIMSVGIVYGKNVFLNQERINIFLLQKKKMIMKDYLIFTIIKKYIKFKY